MRYTEAEILDKVKKRLGDGVIGLEFTQSAIEEALEDALDLYNSFFRNYRIVNINASADLSSYDIPNVDEVLSALLTDNAGNVLDNENQFTKDSLSYLPIKAGTVTVTIGSVTGIDDSDGNITGAGITTGTIDYITGAVNIVLDLAVTGDTSVIFTYKQIIKEELSSLDVFDVKFTSGSGYPFSRVLNPFVDIPCNVTNYTMSNYVGMAADYYQALKNIDDMNNLMGIDLDWVYYKETNKLFVKIAENGTLCVNIAVKPLLIDVDDEKTNDFIKVVRAYAKQILGRIRSKHKNVSIPGGTLELDGDTLLTEAKEDLVEVRERWNAQLTSGFILAA